MSDLIQLRCSSLPLAFKCPGSVRRGRVLINETNDAADLGTAAHEGLAKLVNTGRVDYDGVPELARKHGVNETDLRVLLAQGAKLWEQVKAGIPDPMTEVELSHTLGPLTLTGHADILGRSANAGHVDDWKTGRNDSDYSEQLKGYAALALLEDGTLASATAGVLWVRDCEYEHYTMDRAGLYDWLQRVEDEIVQWDGTFRPGKHCEYCPRGHECVARNALVRRDVAAISDRDLVGHVEDAETLAAMTAERKVEILQQADRVGKLAERVRAAIRADVAKHGDIVGSGVRLTLVTEERRKLDTWAAFPVLEAAAFTDEQKAEVIDISLSRAEDVAASRAGKGKGAAAKRELRAALEGAGAIKIETITKLVQKRA